MTLVKVVDRSESSYQRFQGAEITHGGRLLGLQLSVIVNGDIEQAPPTVTFEQFCALVAEAMHRDHNSVDDLTFETSKLYSCIDKFGKGVITPDALFAFFKSIGDDVPKELVDAMMDAIDTDLNGDEVSEAELRTFLDTCNCRATKPTILRMPRAPFSLYASMMQELLDFDIDASTEKPPAPKQDALFSMVELKKTMDGKQYAREVTSKVGVHSKDGKGGLKPQSSLSGADDGHPRAPRYASSSSPSEQASRASEAGDGADEQSQTEDTSLAEGGGPSASAEISADDTDYSDEE